MTPRPLSAALLLITLLACGCSEEKPGKAPVDSDRASSSEPSALPDAVTGHTASNDAPTERAREQRIASLRTEIADAQAQRTQLLQRQAETEARIIAYQEKGLEQLSSLKAQIRASTGLDASFEARAKRELEAVLAQDESMATELRTTNEDLARIESRIGEIEDELATLSKAPSDSRTEP